MRDASRWTGAEPADEADDHCDGAIAEIDDRTNVLRGHQFESRQHGQVAVQFRIGSKRNLEAAEELRCRPQRITLRNVGWNGKCCSPDLIDEGKMSAQLRTQGQQISLVGEFLGGAPGVEPLELPHGAERTADGWR